MEENKQIVKITCRHEGCGKTFKIVLPKKPGAYKYELPCGHVNTIKFIPKDIKMGGTAGAGKSESPKAENNSPANVVECPWGCGTKFNFEPKDDGEKEHYCPKCNGRIKIKVEGGKVVGVEKKETEIITPPLRPVNASKGKLTLVRFRGIFGNKANKSYTLHLGQNTVGRYDEELHSDIEIKGDTYASRRSVVIEVIDKQPGYLFKMTVLRAANPVMHNNKPLIVGESVYLNFGDSIKLGNTTFNFDKA